MYFKLENTDLMTLDNGNGLSLASSDLNILDGGTGAIELQASNFASGSGGLGIIRNDVGNDTIYLAGDDNGTGHGNITVLDSTGQASIVLSAATGVTSTPILQITGGSDLAERFNVGVGDETPAPGLVVCIDPERPGDLVVSRRAHDRTVAGVISGAGGVNPGMLMGQRGTVADGDHPVALTGRVFVRCDASSGSIQPGDLLTTSNRPGHAMKVVDYDAARGAIIGKAMGSLESGQDLVLVLVSLQ